MTGNTSSSRQYASQWPSEVFEDVLDTIGGDRWRYTMVHGPKPRPPVPSSTELADLVAVALSASLEREEGRDVLFTLTCIPAPGERALSLAQPLSLAPEHIRKIAAAVPLRLGLGVSTGDARLTIWGITERQQDAVEVRAVAPGRVVVQFGLINVARFEGATCSVFRADAVDLLQVIADKILPQLDEEAYVLAFYLIQLGAAVRMFRHGGTIIWTPSHDSGSARSKPGYAFVPAFDDLAIQYRHDVSAYRQRLKARIDESDLYLLATLPGVEALLEDQFRPTPDSTRITEMVQRAAHLAAVDGAVVMGADLTIRSAGTVLEAPSSNSGQWQEWEPTAPAWNDGSGPLTRLGGTRHRSAFNFVAACPGAVAVVCSQDGRLTIMARPTDDEDVHLVSHLEHALVEQ